MSFKKEKSCFTLIHVYNYTTSVVGMWLYASCGCQSKVFLYIYIYIYIDLCINYYYCMVDLFGSKEYLTEILEITRSMSFKPV